MLSVWKFNRHPTKSLSRGLVRCGMNVTRSAYYARGRFRVYYRKKKKKTVLNTSQPLEHRCLDRRIFEMQYRAGKYIYITSNVLAYPRYSRLATGSESHRASRVRQRFIVNDVSCVSSALTIARNGLDC